MVHSIKNLQSLYYTVTQVKQSLSQYITRQDFGGNSGGGGKHFLGGAAV